MEKKPVISIVSPFFNEEEVVPLFLQEVTAILKPLQMSYEIICVNDGSTDNTLARLIQAKVSFTKMRIINLSRNFGKEAALTAGLEYSAGEVVIPMDADLQDPPELINEFIGKWQEGYDVVVGMRVDRSSDSFAKRFTAEQYYSLHNKISRPKIPENVGDYRLITRKVVNAILQLPENQRFMKGIFAWVGFKTAVVEYNRTRRRAGKSSFRGWGLWNLALEGITGFSTVPLRISLYLGSFIATLSICYGCFIVLRTLIQGVDLPGYASLLTSILFLGGVQLMGIGILGEYIGRIYLESKQRPNYIVEAEY